MSDLVKPDEIERLVGAERHETDHIGRAVSTAHTVYILHSAECRDSGRDLRQCPYSIALDRGIEHFIPWSGWRHAQDQPVKLQIFRGHLVPNRQQTHPTEGA